MSEFFSVGTPDRAVFTGGAALILAMLALPVSGCQPEDFSFQAADMTFTADEMEAVALSSEIEAPPLQAGQLASSQGRLIRSGSARVEVSDLESAVSEVRQIGESLGGYVAGSELREGREGARSASLVLRIPSDSVDVLIESLPDLGQVLSVSISTQDVSREYVDVETRLAVQEETVERLRELAARGGSLEDLLAAERELGRAVSQLESLKGQIRYYDQRLAESDIRLSLVEPGAVVGSGAFRPLFVAFRRSVEVFAGSLAYIVYFVTFTLPWVALALLLFPFARRWWVARRERRAAESS